MTKCLLDTGPLVSLLAAGSRHHAWAVQQWKRLRPPLLTCEPVLTEAAFLLTRERHTADVLFTLLERGVIRIAISVEEEREHLRALMHCYRNRPMSLADACLVRLSEIHSSSEIFTLDSDFRVYRRGGNKGIPVLMPDEWALTRHTSPTTPLCSRGRTASLDRAP